MQEGARLLFANGLVPIVRGARQTSWVIYQGCVSGENSPLNREAQVNLRTLRLSMAARVLGSRPSTALKRSQCGNSFQRLLFLLALLFANCFAFGPSIAASCEMPSNSTWDSALVAEPPDQQSRTHSEVLAAGFGFQAAGYSMIMVRTYDALTGAILSDDSFDLSVKEDGATGGDERRGRIFAGGIGIDPTGKSKFMLSVYDAETGTFLWEGQLNFLRSGDDGVAKVGAYVTQSSAPAFIRASNPPEALDTFFFLRAVHPITRGLVWQDQFVPGSRRRGRAQGVSIHDTIQVRTSNAISHVFDLVVRTYDRGSGGLLWEDSFEHLDQIEESMGVPETNGYPQSIPSGALPRSLPAMGLTLPCDRRYDLAGDTVAFRLSAHCCWKFS